MTKQTEGRVYAGFDILKLVLAVFVVAIHTEAFSLLNAPVLHYIGTYLFSMVVPFFFAIAGYLLFRKEKTKPLYAKENINRVKKYLLRMIKLYCIWNIIYLPISLYGYRGWQLKYALSDYIRKFFFVGEHYLSWPFWYLLATIYGVGCIYLLMKSRIPSGIILIIGMALYRFSDVLTYWIKNPASVTGWKLEITQIAASTLNSGRIFTSILFLAIGMIIARNTYLKKVNVWIRLILCLAILTLYMYQPAGYIYMIGRPLLVFTGVWFLSGVKLQKRTAYLRIRNASTIMYFTHMLWYFLYILLSDIENPVGMYPFVFCVAGGVLISEIQIIWKKNCIETKKVVVPV